MRESSAKPTPSSRIQDFSIRLLESLNNTLNYRIFRRAAFGLRLCSMRSRLRHARNYSIGFSVVYE